MMFTSTIKEKNVVKCPFGSFGLMSAMIALSLWILVKIRAEMTPTPIIISSDTEAPVVSSFRAAVPQEEIIKLLVHFDETSESTINIRLIPIVSGPTSRDFVTTMATYHGGGRFYRAENQFLLQGSIEPHPNYNDRNAVEKGPCPPGVNLEAEFPDRPCFEHDPNCGCHGPIMKKGDVGWAGGGVGPDFFIVDSPRPVIHWAHDHTVWGRIAGERGASALLSPWMNTITINQINVLFLFVFCGLI